jgi:branched-chain amino acid transport system substrate-binding protein
MLVLSPRTLTATLLAAALALAAGGCLGDEGGDEPPRVEGATATVYLSLPRDGVAAPAARAVETGARMALADSGGQAGGLPIRLRALSTTEDGEQFWDPALVNANAERAASDPSSIAYLGELSLGASAISMPTLNDARLLQVSPEDGLTSLTSTPPGRLRSMPERLWPSGERNFVRLVPRDLLQAETLVELLAERGVERPALVFDQEVYGRELAAQIISRLRRAGLEPVASEEYRGKVEEIDDIAKGLAEGDPDAVIYAGVAGPGTGRMLAAIDSRLPGVAVYTSSGILARDPRRPFPRTPVSVEALTPVRPASELSPTGRRLMRRAGRLGGRAADRPEAVYGYEAMRVILDAVRVGGRDRERVTRTALAMRDRDSALGAYRLRGTGDTDDERHYLYALRDSRFEFGREID